MSVYAVSPQKKPVNPLRSISDNSTGRKGISLPAVRPAFNPAAVQLRHTDMERPLQTKPFQLTADGSVVQLNGKEKALLVLGTAVVMGLGMWLKTKYDEIQAAQKQAAIVNDFEARMQEGGFVSNAQARENNFVLAALRQGVQENVARNLFAQSGAAAKDTVTGYDVGADRIPSVQSAIDYINKTPSATGFYVEVDIRNLGGLNGALGHTGADRVFKMLTDISAGRVESLRSGKIKVAKFRHGGDEFSFLVVAEDGSVAIKDVGQLLVQASEMIQKTIHSTEIGEYNPESTQPHTLISDIEHPKHKDAPRFNGTGIVFGISAILGTDNVSKVFSIADLQVEANKK